MRFFRLSVLFTMLLLCLSAFADEPVTFEVKSPLMVASGEAFRVEFTVNADPDKGSFQAPDFEGFDILAGPSTSTSRNFQIINGESKSSYNVSYIYVLLAQEAGNLTIAPASIEVKGRRYSSQSLPIEIVDESAAKSQQSTQQQGSASRQRATTAEQRAEGQIAKDDLLLRLVLSRNTVFKGEPLRASLKLYQRVPIVGSNGGKYPSFNGFWAQQLEQDEQQVRRENYNGKIYETTTLVEYILYPQQSGELIIDPAEINVVAQVVVQSNRRNDPFFGSMPDIYNVERTLRTDKVTVNVKPLPQGAPSSFAGAVGKFTMSSSMPSEQLVANSAATYTVKISGSGNLSFIQAPKLSLPTSFEQYTTKTTESIRTSQGGSSGYRQFEYPFIARAEGEYEILPVEFSYFDPSTMSYRTLSSKPMTISVAPDGRGDEPSRVVSGMSKEEVKMLGRDIRFIKLGKANLVEIKQPFVLGGLYWAIVAAIGIIYQVLYIILRKRIRDNRNVALVRGKRANKVAIQRFRAAARYMKSNDRRAFYEEMLRAMWGYMGDKLNIPVADLTKENVREQLHRRGVDTTTSHSFSDIVTRCEEAQYSPVGMTDMSDVYADGVEFVSKIESVIKKR